MFKEYTLDMVNLKVTDYNPEFVVYFAVHSRRERVWNFDKMQFTKLSFNRTPTHYFQYQRIKIHSLPEPYETNCVDFQKKGFSSRRNCISDCRLKLQLENKTGEWPGNFFTQHLPNVWKMSDSFNDFKNKIISDQIFGEKC